MNPRRHNTIKIRKRYWWSLWLRRRDFHVCIWCDEHFPAGSLWLVEDCPQYQSYGPDGQILRGGVDTGRRTWDMC